MQAVAHTVGVDRIQSSSVRTRASRSVLTGRILSGLVVALLALDSIGKLLMADAVVVGTTQLGYPVHVIVPLGVTLLSCVILYAIPRTAFLGALLLTGYLGGAVATHVRVDNPLLTHVLAPTYVAALAWAGLVLRDERFRALLPWRRP